MTTVIPGGRVTGFLALTFATDVALNKNDFVHMVGDYKVGLADGTKPVIGQVSVKSVKRVNVSGVSTSFPVATTTGGQVTVEVLGFAVQKCKSGQAIAAGAAVAVHTDGTLYTLGSDTRVVGIALTAASGANQDFDLLLRHAA